MDTIDDKQLVDHGWSVNGEPGFTAAVGPVWERPEGERIRYGLLTHAMHANLNGIVHGGLITVFADFVLAMESRWANQGARQATIQLDVHFADAVQIGEFIEAECSITRATRSLTFVTGRILVGERVVASANGIWKIQRRCSTP
jgi:acyl-coenzyme A thioesterase PaaI-like protein